LEALGLEEGRVQFSWVSAAEGERFSQVIREVTESVKKLGPARRMVKSFEIPEEIEKEIAEA
jgi:coenzyme F420-reducing hydrogenase delta subunit